MSVRGAWGLQTALAHRPAVARVLERAVAAATVDQLDSRAHFPLGQCPSTNQSNILFRVPLTKKLLGERQRGPSLGLAGPNHDLLRADGIQIRQQ